MADNVLHVEHITMQFGGVVAVNDLTLDVDQGEIVALIGPNGAGKTTAFNCVTGVYEPTNGLVSFRGQPIIQNHPQGKLRAQYAGEHGDLYKTAMVKTPDQITRLGIARTFQNIRLFKDLTVLENVKVAFNQSMKYSVLGGILRLPGYWREEEEIDRKARDILSVFHMEDQVDQKAQNLPYGRQRKLEIARAIATGAKILLLDEPAAGMNPTETAELMEAITLIRTRFGVSILLIEHDMSLVMSICERLIVIDYGQIIAAGTPYEVANDPKVIGAYLGQDEEGMR